MWQLSTYTRYGIKAMCALGRHYGCKPVPVRDLAKTEAIPRQFLHRILWSLKEARLVHSKRGPGGGYVLTKPPDQVTIATVLRLIDGPLEPLDCATGSGCLYCKDPETCGLRLTGLDLKAALTQILERITLTDLATKAPVP